MFLGTLVVYLVQLVERQNISKITHYKIFECFTLNMYKRFRKFRAQDLLPIVYVHIVVYGPITGPTGSKYQHVIWKI